MPAHELERWPRIFLEQGKRGLRTKAEPEERELILARENRRTDDAAGPAQARAEALAKVA